MKDTIPYTYLVGWSSLNRFYYGVRYQTGCNPADLWVSYFTSSKYVKEVRKLFGEPDIIQIRRVFKTKKESMLWEHKVLRRLNVTTTEKWINKTDNKAIDYKSCKRDNRKGSVAGAAKIRGKKYHEFMDPKQADKRLAKKSEYLKANPISKKGQKKPSPNYKTGTQKQWADPEARQRKIDGLKLAWQKRREEGRLPKRKNGRFA